MGSSASKTTKTAGSAVRQYPTRSPTSTTTRSPVASAPKSPAAAVASAVPGQNAHAPRQATESKTAAVLQDVRDPAFAQRLSSLGAVQPNPHYSNTSTSQFDPRRNVSHNEPSDMMQAPPQSPFPDPRNNPTLRVLEARQRIAEEAEEEMRDVGRKGFAGRKYVDAGIIQLALMRQARGEPDARIEDALGIKQGRLGVLGRDVIGPAVTY
ncbi:hypothetical protein ACN47E_001231 [Coniothyrium glycines]